MGQRIRGRKCSLQLAAYLWNMIHCAALAMLSCVSFSADSLASTASAL